VEIADCLRKKQVYPGKSIDEFNHERFHPLSFSAHFLGKFPRWLKNYAENKLLSVRLLILSIRKFLVCFSRDLNAVVIQQFLFIMLHLYNNI
jgi:hypothetical protein